VLISDIHKHNQQKHDWVYEQRNHREFHFARADLFAHSGVRPTIVPLRRLANLILRPAA
jgi:hypothetical protein